MLDLKDRQDIVSVGHLKPAHLDQLLVDSLSAFLSPTCTPPLWRLSDLALSEPQSHGLSSGSTVKSLVSVLPKVVVAATRSLAS